VIEPGGVPRRKTIRMAHPASFLRSRTVADSPADAERNAEKTATAVVYVCITCRQADEPEREPRPGLLLADATERAAIGTEVEVRRLRCLANCTRGPSAAMRGNGSWTYLFGGLDPSCADALVAGARLLAADPTGILPWRGRPEPLKGRLIARVPPLDFLEPDL
jgi:predicted metal-binding protein